MTETLHLDENGPFDVYVARPPAGTPIRGGLIVIHEIWGLVDHIKGIADRFAEQGWLAAAPDLLGRAGVTAEIGEELLAIQFSDDETVRNEGQPRLREALAPVRAPEFASFAVPALGKLVDWLETQSGCTGKVAVTGFCFGGTYSFALAAADSRVKAAVPFYGAPPEGTELAKIQVPVLAFYGDQDERLMKSLPDVEKGMQDAGVDFEATVYEGTGHAFFNDTNAHAYDAQYADDAWKSTLSFLDEHVV